MKKFVFIPVATYFLSYLYLAYYHNTWFLGGTIIHEGGKLTFFETCFYASHFLGHLLVHLVAALLFVGSALSFNAHPYKAGRALSSFAALFLYLALAAALSFTIFGYEETEAFFLLKKQSEAVTKAPGGSWNLHLPSTLLLFFLTPLFILVTRQFMSLDTQVNSSGLPFLTTALFLTCVTTAAVNPHPIDVIVSLWQEPRYLAHSVRELATFPLTYFPLGMCLLAKGSCEPKKRIALPSLTLCLALALFIPLAYQVFFVLQHGVSNLAQKPIFAQHGRLSIAYLLSSHFFEHFLDTLFFLLACRFFFSLPVKKERGLQWQN